MENDKPRLTALTAFKFASEVYLEAHKKHGESGAVAASADLFSKYHDAASSEEYIAATHKRETNYVPESGLDANDLDDFFKKPACAGVFEACKAREVNDSDVRALVKKSGPQQLPTNSQGSKSLQTPKTFGNYSKALEQQNQKSFAKQHEVIEIDNYFNAPARNDNQPTQPYRSKTVGFTQSSNASQSKTQSNLPNSSTQPKSLLDQINNNLYKRHSLPAPPSSNEVPVNFQKQPAAVAPPPTNPPEDPSDKSYLYPSFKSSAAVYHIQQSNKHSASNNFSRHQGEPPQKKRLGVHAINPQYKAPWSKQQQAPPADELMQVDSDEYDHPLLKGIDPKLIDQIKREVVNSGKPVEWNDIAGLEKVKQSIREAVSLPLEHPWLFSGNGMLKLEKGILLFGPPGTGKTLIAKCVSAQSQATFFSISASTLTSKWIGEGEKLVKALFAYAKLKQPSVIFIDEIDSILTKRGDNDHESSTRLKTEFMVQIDGASSTIDQDRILVIGATNRPQKLDEAIIRRFSKRFYIPLPDLESRAQLLTNLLRKEENHSLTGGDILRIATLTEGYSGDDLCKVGSQAAIYRVREMCAQGGRIEQSMMRPVSVDDFMNSLREVKATVGQEDLQHYTDWSNKVGSN